MHNYCEPFESVDGHKLPWQTLSASAYAQQFGYSPSETGFIKEIHGDKTLFLGMPSAELALSLRKSGVAHEIHCSTEELSIQEFDSVFSYYGLGACAVSIEHVYLQFQRVFNSLKADGSAMILVRGVLPDYIRDLPQGQLPGEIDHLIKTSKLLTCRIPGEDRASFIYDISEVASAIGFEFTITNICEFPLKAVLNKKGELKSNLQYPVMITLKKKNSEL